MLANLVTQIANKLAPPPPLSSPIIYTRGSRLSRCIRWNKFKMAATASLSVVAYENGPDPKTYTEHCAACSNQTQMARVYQNADRVGDI